ncbi:hypothetical protein [Gluconacetobacter tumulisoli]|uniref:Uncharacterized protein n=1 Tax=Gluconacetobacter tumulisoli TaxID=1286189 RepID=A0A7W4PLY1_9PROT|nr:hypothetical protein [Gluconacetobacter tumulisoli]MBB2202957.1 hypothetical protein [Gluconacetobacter tumulisoli]
MTVVDPMSEVCATMAIRDIMPGMPGGSDALRDVARPRILRRPPASPPSG